jgi:hypothetical protein
MTFHLRDVIVLSRHSLMSSTSKPALLKAIVRIVSATSDRRIALTQIGEQFVALYWNQTVVFHLRQAAVISKEPAVLRRIRATSESVGTRDLGEVPGSSRDRLVRSMIPILKTDVLRRFHNGKPAHMPPLFTWEDGAEFIDLSDESFALIKADATALEMIANYWWAKYLEKVNTLAPYIIEKVQRNGARRHSLDKYLHVLKTVDAACCFYCSRPFAEMERCHIDHVLPWSFLLEDPLWDLVMACSRCNLAKSDWLPARDFVGKLIATNEIRAKSTLRPNVLSPLLDGDRIFQLYDAARGVEWPGPWSPADAGLALP